MKDLYFDVRDVFRTSRIALSGKKIWVHLLGLLSGWSSYFIMTYIALLAAGQSIPEIWNNFHLFPCLFGSTVALPWFSWLIYAVGILIWVFLFLFFSTAVSRISYKQLKGDEFFSSGDAFQYAKKHAKAALFSPISILLIIAFFIIMAIIAAWIAQWPVLDIVFFGLPYLLYFVVAVFVIYTALSFIIALLLGPSIVGTAEEDTMETVFQSYSTLWTQPWRLVCYEVVVGATTALSTFIFGYFMIAGYKFFNFVFGQNWLMGGKLTNIVEKASSYIWGANSTLSGIVAKIFRIEPSSVVGSASLAGTDVVVAILVTISLFLIGASVVAYALTNITVGQSLIYVILRKKKDSESLLERKDEDEIEEEEEMEDIPDIEDEEFTEEEFDEDLEEDEEESSESGQETEDEDKG